MIRIRIHNTINILNDAICYILHYENIDTLHIDTHLFMQTGSPENQVFPIVSVLR